MKVYASITCLLAVVICGSARAQTNFTLDNSDTIIKLFGLWTTGSGGGHPYLVNTAGGQEEVIFSVHGTALTMCVDDQSTLNAMNVSVDGGAYSAVAVSATNSFVNTVIFTGLANDGGTNGHLVKIQYPDHLTFVATDVCLVTAIGTPSISAPPGIGTFYSLAVTTSTYQSWLRMEGGPNIQTPNTMKQVALGWSDSSIGFRATTTSISAFAYGSGTDYYLWIDGIKQSGPLALPSNSVWQDVSIATGLDGSAEHLYEIRPSSVSASNSSTWLFIAQMWVTGSINTSYSPVARPPILGYGDSITAGLAATGNDSTLSWLNQVGSALGKAVFNAGIGSTLVTSGGNNGLGRTAAVTTASPAPGVVLVLYGTNDIASAITIGNKTTSGTFTFSYFTMMTNLIAGLPGGTKVYCLGILPRGDSFASSVATYNTAIQTAIAGLACTYVDTSGWLNGTVYNASTNPTGDTVEGLHPNVINGIPKLVNRVETLLSPATLFRRGNGNRAGSRSIGMSRVPLNAGAMALRRGEKE